MFFDIDKKEEIALNYVSNTIIRVKRMNSGDIEYLPLEEYIVGVLAGEMPIYFEKEAFKAQAVAARSYALKRIEYNKNEDYDVVDSIMNQVYLDEILEYDGEVIDALFFSTSNGYTEDASLVFNIDLPYL